MVNQFPRVNEVWQRVPRFPQFQINNYGDIQDEEGYLLERSYPGINGDEVDVHLISFERSFRGPVWFLMLNAFFEGNLNGVQFRYIDGDPVNLHLDNLIPIYEHPREGWIPIAWEENLDGKRVLDRRKKLNRVQIIETGEVFNSVSECAFAIKGISTSIYSCLRGTAKKHKGYTFRLI